MMSTDLSHNQPRGRWILLLLWGILFVNCGGEVIAQGAERPNIVVILADDLGYGDPGCYNEASKIATPHIDRLATDGMRFTDAHSCGSVCVPSRYGLLTGRYPFRAASMKWRERALIEPDVVTLPQLLKQHGYRTACVGKWHLGFDEGTKPDAQQQLHGGPVHRGFETFFGLPASLDLPPYFYIRDSRAVALPTNRIEKSNTPGWDRTQGAFWREGPIAPGFVHAEVLPLITMTAAEQINHYAADANGGPFFLYVALTAPHTPWLPAQKFNGKSGASLYGDFVMNVDQTVGDILAALEAQQLADDTLVVFTSDNGPVWFAEDVERLGHSSTGNLRGKKGDAWEGGHRVPFIVRWPGRIEPGSTSEQMLCHADLMATFAAAAEIDVPARAGQDSHDFLPVLTGAAPHKAVRETMITQTGRDVLSLREGDWKWIPVLGSGGFLRAKKVTPQPGGPTGQLYNLEEDPSETTNLWQRHPDVVQRLSARLEEITTAK